MKRFLAAFVIVSCLFSTSKVSAQDPGAMPKPQKEHEWMQGFVGEWDSEAEASMPGMPAMKCKGTMKCKLLGGFWMLGDVAAEMPGITVSAQFTLGYDGEKKKYVGTWIDSSTSHLWHYVGSVDASGKKLTLSAEGPDMLKPGKMCKYHDIYEFKSKDHIVLTSEVQGEDGKWTTFMTSNLRRKR